MTLGIIDVGTNSIHCLVGILGLNGAFHVILKERDLTRLGDGGLARGSLTPASMHRALEVLARYAKVLKRCRVDHVEAVATSAVREASNGREFVRRVRARTGLPLRIISGKEEARLIYLGVLQAHQVHRSTLIVAIGGGSLQLIHGDGAHVRYATSLPLGCARLTERFVFHDPVQSSELEALDGAVRQALAPAAGALRRHQWGQTFGSSATIAQVMAAAYCRAKGKPPKSKHRLSVSRRALRELIDWLAESEAKERIQLPGLDPRREDLALATAVTLLAVMDLCKIPTIRYEPGSLREGLVMDYLIRHHLGKVPRFSHPLISELLDANGGGARLMRTVPLVVPVPNAHEGNGRHHGRRR
jgi:exopolyphosphatase/guanosine-5'-triphosphate,3'-diphosphate pyrophosphatase